MTCLGPNMVLLEDTDRNLCESVFSFLLRHGLKGPSKATFFFPSRGEFLSE